MSRTFVGFGFGPIQSALFLYEAFRSGNFSRFVVAEVDASLVSAIRNRSGQYSINIARPDRIDQETVTGVELYNPREEVDRAKIIIAIEEADELATALPSVDFFGAGGSASVASVLAEALSRRDGTKPAVVYAAENNNHAAERLEEAVKQAAPAINLRNIQFLNTVIGKMSGVISDGFEISRLGLATMTPAINKAILVEEFNRILISKITLPGFVRGIEVFEEKPDLLPYEEAKLYGHNAIHALIGYLCWRKGLTTMAQAARHDDIIQAARSAFMDESGAALCKKYAHLNDAMFSDDGYRRYVNDLLARMINPNLNDLVARVIRDPLRKLGYQDRLFGAMRLALEYELQPINLARGAAVALDYFSQSANRAIGSQQQVGELLREIWGESIDRHAQAMIDLTWHALSDTGSV